MRVVLGVAVVALACAAGLAAQPAALVVLLTFVPQGDADAIAPCAAARRSSAQPIDLRVSDGRELADPRVLGSGTDDDDRPFPIHASMDVPPFVDQTIGTLIAARRITRAPSASRRLQLRLVRFHVDERNKAVGSTYSAEVQFTYVMTDASGATAGGGRGGRHRESLRAGPQRRQLRRGAERRAARRGGHAARRCAAARRRGRAARPAASAAWPRY